MKAFTYLKDKKLTLLDRERPAAKDNSVIVKILSAAICGTDLRTYRFGSDRIVAPRTIGHEACGEIQEVGKNVRGFKPGDRVMTVPAIGCGHCRWCKQGATNMCENLKTVGFDYDGTFAEYMEVPAQAISMGNLLHIDDSIPTEQVVIVEPAACCLNGQSFLNIGPEDTVFIFGAGFIGSVHAEFAMLKGAEKIILSDISDARLEIVKRVLPQVTTINTMKNDVMQFIQEFTSGRGADVIITAAPSGAAQASALAIAATRARISLFGGLPGEGAGFLNSNTIHYKELSLFGSHASTVAQNKQVLSWISSGKIDLHKYVSASFPLEKIEDAFESLKSEKMVKVLITP